MAIRVVLAEDSYLVREGIRGLLETRPQLELVATCGDLSSLLGAVEAQRPDVVLTDIRVHVRRLMAIAITAAVALAVALVIVAATSGDSTPVARSSAPSHAIMVPPATCGVHYDGSSLTGKPCPTKSH